jgi:hypothetical protein
MSTKPAPPSTTDLLRSIDQSLAAMSAAQKKPHRPLASIVVCAAWMVYIPCAALIAMMCIAGGIPGAESTALLVAGYTLARALDRFFLQ